MIKIVAISSAIFYLLPTRLITRIRPGLIRRIFQIGPIGDSQTEIELVLTTRTNRHLPPIPPRVLHPVRPAQQNRPRRNRHRNRRNNRQQEQIDPEIIVHPPAPPYQAREPSVAETLVPVQWPSTHIRDPTPFPPAQEESLQRPIAPIRVPRPTLCPLSPNHVDSRLAIRSGPAHTSVLCGWVVNTEQVRVERYFWEDKHKDGASYLESLSFQEAEISSDASAKRAYENYLRHCILCRQELELVWELGHIANTRPFDDDIRSKYTTTYIDILNIRLAIQDTADSIRFRPGTHRYQFIKSLRNIIAEIEEEEIHSTPGGAEATDQTIDLTATSEEE